jgi:hypothetical protein
MSIDQTRAQVISSVWQAIAQSGVDLSSVPQEQQEKLVGKIADNLLMAVNAMLEEEAPMSVEEDEVDENDEKILWKGRPFLSLVENYTVTSERLKIITGLMTRHVENFELIRIQDIDFNQGMTERMFGIGDITIRGHDPSNPEIKLRNVSKPEEVYEIMRRAWLEARKRHGMQFREYM